MSDPRNDIQGKAKDAFLATEGKATLVLGTGVGKSRIAINACESWINLLYYKHNINPTILILVPSERLRDHGWREEIVKWAGKYRYLDSVVSIQCYQTAHRLSHQVWDIVIADEIDFALTEQYAKFFRNNQIRVIIGLTAYVADEKKELLNSIAPVCFSYSTQDGQRDGILNKTAFYQVNFDLSNTKNISIPMKGGRSFMQSEVGLYNYLDEQFNKSLYAMSALRKQAARDGLLGGEASMDQATKKAEWKFKTFSRKRKELLHSLKSSVQVTKLLLGKIKENLDNRVLIFSKLTSQIDQIVEHTFHSKNKELDKLSHFSNCRFAELGVCEAVNRGVNLVEVNNIIIESYVGSETDFQQKHGRGVRLDPSKTLNFFLLVPHVHTRAAVKQDNGSILWQQIRRPTQAGSWKERMTDSFNMSNIKTIEMTQDREGKYSLPNNYNDICSSS